MLVDLFTALTAALTQSPEIAIGAAFAWGILSVILSPCHIACIPLIVGFIDGQGNIPTRRAFGLSLLFGLGILITIGLIGLITGLAGRMMGDIGGYGNYVVAIVFFVIGLNLLGILPLPFMEGGANPTYKKEGISGGIYSGADLRRCPGALHIRLYGYDAGCGVQHGIHTIDAGDVDSGGVCRRPLCGAGFCRNIYRGGPALSALERKIQRRGYPQKGLRCFGDSGRRLSDCVELDLRRFYEKKSFIFMYGQFLPVADGGRNCEPFPG